MGVCFSGAGDSGAPARGGSDPGLTIAFIGLDGAGKTSAVVALEQAANQTDAHSMLPPAPSATVQRSTVRIQGVMCTVVDVPGHISREYGPAATRGSWAMEVLRAHRVVFVVDGTDTLRLPIAARELAGLAQLLSGREAVPPLLVLVSKQDVPGALPAAAVEAALDLPRALARVPYRVCAASMLRAASFLPALEKTVAQIPVPAQKRDVAGRI